MLSSTSSRLSSRAAYLRAASDLRDNPGQWDAYESKGHCVVLAGPGSGKTRTLTIKMARMLAEDVPEPRGIACITYNNECARELEERLAALGVEPSRRVFVGTVHSFSLTQIILPYAKVAGMGLPDGFRVATRAERADAMRAALVGHADAQGLENRLSEYRRTHLDRDGAAWRDTDADAARLVEAFETQLRRRGLIDFDDMPLLAVRALRAHPWLQQALLAKYPVLVVDEYQDLGLALHQMVMGLCFRTGMRLFAVGDVDQSIYGFTGARPDLLQKLSERADVQTVPLRLNYRCGNRIVAASRAALGQNRNYEAVKGAKQGAVYIHALGGRYEDQAAHLVGKLLPQALARNPGLGYGDVAVLYPFAWQGDSVANVATASDLPFVRTDSKALYPRNSRLMQWLEMCGQWCCGGWKTGRPRFSKVMDEGRRLFSEGLTSEPALLDFHGKLISCLWPRRDPGLKLHDWFNDLVEQVIEPFADECVALHDELETLAAFMVRVDPDGDCADMVLASLAGDGSQLNRLTLSSLHSAKGREFGLVFIFGLDSRYFPHPKSNASGIQESRRLFYVGFTRAKSEIHLVHTFNGASAFVDRIRRHLEQV